MGTTEGVSVEGFAVDGSRVGYGDGRCDGGIEGAGVGAQDGAMVEGLKLGEQVGGALEGSGLGTDEGLGVGEDGVMLGKADGCFLFVFVFIYLICFVKTKGGF